jgi:CheY-like chemotaxis protein
VESVQLQVVMVVEDDRTIQGLVEDALVEGGFLGAIVASGEEAMTLLTGSKGKYRALVTDVNLLGRKDGWDVAKHAREIDPDFSVIYMTGAAANESRTVFFLRSPCASAAYHGNFQPSEYRPRLGPPQPVQGGLELTGSAQGAAR